MHGSALRHRDCLYSELDYNNRKLYDEATKLFPIVSHACVILDKCISFKQGVSLQAFQDTQCAVDTFNICNPYPWSISNLVVHARTKRNSIYVWGK